MTEQSKTALTLGAGVIASGVTLALVASQPIVGGLMIALGAILVIADYIYGRYNRGESLVLPEGVDEALIKELAEAGEDDVREIIERYKK